MVMFSINATAFSAAHGSSGHSGGSHSSSHSSFSSSRSSGSSYSSSRSSYSSSRSNYTGSSNSGRSWSLFSSNNKPTAGATTSKSFLSSTPTTRTNSVTNYIVKAQPINAPNPSKSVLTSTSNSRLASIKSYNAANTTQAAPNKATILTPTSAGRINNINSYVASNSPPKVAPPKNTNILVATKGAPTQRTTVVNNYNNGDNGRGFLTGMLVGHALSQQPQHVTVVSQPILARNNESPTVVHTIVEPANHSAYALSGFKNGYCGGSVYCDTVGYKNPF